MAWIKRGLVAVAAVYSVALAVVLALRVVLGDRLWWLSFINTFTHLLFLPLAIFVPLVVVLRARMMALRMLPLVLIGGLWYAPYFLPKTSVPASGKQLHVLTANIWGNNHDLRQIEVWLRDVQADLVLLQEISPTYATDSLPGLLDLYPYQHAQPDDTRWGGNITLSRFPIVDSGYVDLQTLNTPSPEYVILDVDGQEVAVYNVHLEFPVETARLALPINNKYVQFVLGYDDDVRNQQIERLLAHLAGEKRPFILGGDFNTSDQAPTYNLLAAQMIDSYRVAGRGFGGSWPVVAARGDMPRFMPPLVRIDYIWHNDQLRTAAAWRGQPIGSDHLPMHAIITMPIQ